MGSVVPLAGPGRVGPIWPSITNTQPKHTHLAQAEKTRPGSRRPDAMPSPSPPPPVLPISEHEDEIVAAVDANPVVVVIGETGSGKSTQLSQILHRRGYTRRGAIAVTQPRRVAAVSVSRFLFSLPSLLYHVREACFLLCRSQLGSWKGL